MTQFVDQLFQASGGTVYSSTTQKVPGNPDHMTGRGFQLHEFHNFGISTLNVH